MPAKLSLAAIIAILVLPAALAQWPAASLATWVEDGSGGRWSLGSADGTLWNGSATLLAADGSAGSRRWRPVQSLHWKLRWSEMWHGRLSYETTLEHGSALINFGLGGIAVEKLDAQLPAAVLGGLFSGPLARYGWTGTLAAKSASFDCRWNAYACAGEIEIAWNQAGITEISDTVLGSYRSRIVGEGQAVHFDLATLEGRLQISGNGDVNAAGMRFIGQAYAQGANADRLEAHLRTFGRRGPAPGVYVLEYRTGGTGA